MKTLLVIDNEELKSNLALKLELSNFKIVSESTENYSSSMVIIIELNGNINLFKLIKKIRVEYENNDALIVCLDSISDYNLNSLALANGADVVCESSIRTKQLIAQINSLKGLKGRKNNKLDVLKIHNLEIDTKKRLVRKENELISLTPKEYNILVYLHKHKEEVISRDRLLKRIWGYDFAGETRTVDVHVKNLRLKIEDDPKNPQIIQTIIGVGYSLTDKIIYIETEQSKEKEIKQLEKSVETLSKTYNKAAIKNVQRKIELETIIESINQGLIAFNSSHEVKFINKELKNIYDIKSSDISLDQLFKIDDNLIKVFNSIKNNKDKVYKLKEKKYKDRYLTYKSKNIISDTNEELGGLIFVEDVTEIYQLEHMRRNFVSNVSHELKTPLTSIKGFAETLKSLEKPSKETKDKFLSIIEVESDRLANLINDILTLSEIEETINVELHTTSLRDSVENVIELLSGKIKKDVVLETNYNNELPYNIKATTEYLRQLVQNILSNAIKYTEKGSVTVEIETNKDITSFIVQDTGRGIPQDALDKVFERFYRVDKARDRNNGGTGLGLSIVKHISEILNAEVIIDSEVGIGTKIEIQFKNL